MKYNQLGNSDIKVSEICLGTMTWGEQNNEDEAHQQLNYALENGVNFIDTAEMYSIPPRASTQGLSETYIGTWLRKQQRDQLVIATKATGPASWMKHLRGGPRLNRKHIESALNDSLKRLQTDYIDLYQLHWPERNTNYFGKLSYIEQHEDDAIDIEESFQALNDLVQIGKIRRIGVSNETAWGISRFLQLSGRRDWPRIVSIQNPYNLLNRSFEIALAEFSHRDNIGLLAYSPLGFGVLSGKYINGAADDNARLNLYKDYTRYTNKTGVMATRAYVDIAEKNKLQPAKMALAFVNSRPFLTSTIIGATTMQQLRDNIASTDLILDDDVIANIEGVQSIFPNPCP